MGQHSGKELSQCTHKIPQIGMNAQGNFRVFVPAPFLLTGPPKIVQHVTDFLAPFLCPRGRHAHFLSVVS